MATHWENRFGGEALSAVGPPREQPCAGDVPGLRVPQLRATGKGKGEIFPWIRVGWGAGCAPLHSIRNLCVDWKMRGPEVWFQRAQRAAMKRKLRGKHQGISCLIKKWDLVSKEWVSSSPRQGGCAQCVPGCDSELLRAHLLLATLLQTRHSH